MAAETDQTEIKVYYNSACPVCDAGIKEQKDKMGQCPVQWRDIHVDQQARTELPADLEFARKRLHVIDEQGRVLVGPEAFAAIWRYTPGDQWKAKLICAPVIKPLATLGYNIFAWGLYRWNRWRKRW